MDTPNLDQLAAAAAQAQPQPPGPPSLPLVTPPMWPEPQNFTVDFIKLTGPTGDTAWCVTITSPNFIGRVTCTPDQLQQMGRMFIEQASGLVMP